MTRKIVSISLVISRSVLIVGLVMTLFEVGASTGFLPKAGVPRIVISPQKIVETDKRTVPMIGEIRFGKLSYKIPKNQIKLVNGAFWLLMGVWLLLEGSGWISSLVASARGTNPKLKLPRSWAPKAGDYATDSPAARRRRPGPRSGPGDPSPDAGAQNDPVAEDLEGELEDTAGEAGEAGEAGGTSESVEGRAQTDSRIPELLDEAVVLLESGRPAAALGRLDEIRQLSQEPSNSINFYLMVAYLANERPEEALSLLASTEWKAFPLVRRYKLAVAFESGREWDTALEIFESVQSERSKFYDTDERIHRLEETRGSGGIEAIERELIALVSDHYTSLRIIGNGGMGLVLRGFSAEMKIPVAIKMLST